MRQELALDCLEHAAEIVELEPRARTARWFRVVQAVHYRLCARGERATGSRRSAVDSLEGGDLAASRVWLAEEDRWWLDALREASVLLDNGRINAMETARLLGVGRRDFRELWHHLAERLGFGDDYVAFWRRRLREALVQRAADLLRAAGSVQLFAERHRSAPDPSGSRRRIERIRSALGSLPPRPDIERAIAVGVDRHATPGQLLEHAAILEPGDPGVALWQFEIAIAHEDLDSATTSLAQARQLDTAPVPLILAEARLAEATEGRDAAASVLRTARRDHDDVRVITSLTRCERP